MHKVALELGGIGLSDYGTQRCCSEGDRLSGLIVDVMGDAAVVACSAAWVDRCASSRLCAAGVDGAHLFSFLGAPLLDSERLCDACQHHLHRYRDVITAVVKEASGLQRVVWRRNLDMLREEGVAGGTDALHEPLPSAAPEDTVRRAWQLLAGHALQRFRYLVSLTFPVLLLLQSSPVLPAWKAMFLNERFFISAHNILLVPGTGDGGAGTWLGLQGLPHGGAEDRLLCRWLSYERHDQPFAEEFMQDQPVETMMG